MAALGACSGPLDVDMRGRIGGPVDTSTAAANATGTRPSPDNRGVISYPSYQVAVAGRGDTVAQIAARVGLPAEELAGIPTVCGSLREALTELEGDMDYLLAGDVFTKDQIEGYIELKMEEVLKYETTPHPVEFGMYYSC